MRLNLRLCRSAVIVSIAVQSTFLIACGGNNSNATPNIASATSVLPAAAQATSNPADPQATSSPAQRLITVPGMPPVVTTATGSAVPVHINYQLANAPVTQSARLRRPEYISTSNTQISVTVTPLGGSPTTTGPTSCITGSCPINFTANPGPNTLAFTLTDSGTPVQTLSKFSTTAIIEPNVANTLNFTANPVVNSVNLTLSASAVAAGAPSSVMVNVNAVDIDNNTIVGSGNYVDANGNPLALTLGVSNNADGGSGNVAIAGPSRITAPGQAAIYASYNGNWLLNATISVSSTGSVPGGLGTALLTATPTAYIYSTTTAGTAMAGTPYFVTQGPDGNVWFTEITAAHSLVGKITPSGQMTEYSTGITAASEPYPIVTGSDGNLWFAEQNANCIAKITTQGAVTPYCTGVTGNPRNMIAGPDGNLWYSEYSGGNIGRITTQGKVTEFPGPGNEPFTLTVGPDGNIWFTSKLVNQLNHMTTSGVLLTPITLADPTDTSQVGITTGPDGNIWFNDYANSNACRLNRDGSVSTFSTGTKINPDWITNGPDGALWFAYNGSRALGCVDVQGNVTSYSMNAKAEQITFGSDGNIWFANQSVPGPLGIGKFVL